MLLVVVEPGSRPVRRGSSSPPDSEVVVGAALLAVLSMTVDRPTSTGPVEVLVGVETGASLNAGGVGDTSAAGTPPVPVPVVWGLNSVPYGADSSDEGPDSV